MFVKWVVAVIVNVKNRDYAYCVFQLYSGYVICVGDVQWNPIAGVNASVDPDDGAYGVLGLSPMGGEDRSEVWWGSNVAVESYSVGFLN